MFSWAHRASQGCSDPDTVPVTRTFVHSPSPPSSHLALGMMDLGTAQAVPGVSTGKSTCWEDIEWFVNSGPGPGKAEEEMAHGHC